VNSALELIKNWTSHLTREKALPLDLRAAKLLYSHVLTMNGIFTVKYLLNSAFLSNANQLMDVPQSFGRWWCRKTAVTERQRMEANEPGPFCFGYWYAWTLSVYFLGFCVGALVPLTVFITALFFFAEVSRR